MPTQDHRFTRLSDRIIPALEEAVNQEDIAIADMLVAPSNSP